jgi:hypothetical protein
MASNQSDGPDTCHTVEWPASSRNFVASRAPAAWSTVTSAADLAGSPSIVTSGTSAGRWSSASLADATGAITTIPATRWSRCCSTARPIECRSSTLTLPTLTVNPASAAAFSNATSSDAGP